jgi:hypothetical protein
MQLTNGKNADAGLSPGIQAFSYEFLTSYIKITTTAAVYGRAVQSVSFSTFLKFSLNAGVPDCLASGQSNTGMN